MKWLHLLSLSLTCWLALSGQTQPVVVLSTNWPEVLVYADSVLLGPARYHIFRLPAGKRMLRVVPPEGDTWTIPARTVMLPDTTADTLQIRVTFRYHYRIESVPSGARIFIGPSERQQLLGETPFWRAFEAPLRDTLYLVRSGYAPVALWPGQQIWNRHRVYLQPLKRPVYEVQPWTPTVRRRHWMTYAALGVAVVATAVSIHYKFQADRLYARYEETGDPALRPRIRALDLRAGIALGIAQLGLGVAALRLIFY
ncbi:MAG: hypothetical protein Q9M35_06735 [Rhodothermus sp.]|nr:hypothetical protein [Rhodothermus sp.]